MGRRYIRKRRLSRNRYKSPYGRVPFIRWNKETQRCYWAGSFWDAEAKRWDVRPWNWEPSAPFYFAYGSNLNVGQMLMRAPEAEPFGSMILPNWKLVFRGVADITPAPGEEVAGGLWRITGADEQALDDYEGVDFHLYEKRYFDIHYLDKASKQEVEAKVLVYVMKSDRSLYQPGDSYLNTIQEGYQDFGLDQDKLDQTVKETPAFAPKRYPYFSEWDEAQYAEWDRAGWD